MYLYVQVSQKTSPISSFFLLQQCPTCNSYLSWIVSEIAIKKNGDLQRHKENSLLTWYWYWFPWQFLLNLARKYIGTISTQSSSHHHHHVVPLARISLTLSRHFSLSFIASGRSSGLHPVSSHSCCMYVRAGRPAFARRYVGVNRSTSLIEFVPASPAVSCMSGSSST